MRRDCQIKFRLGHITTAALAPINRDRSINPQIMEELRSKELDISYNARKYALAAEGLDGLVTSVINVATLGFFIPLMSHYFSEGEEEVYTPKDLIPPHMLNQPKEGTPIEKYSVHPLEGDLVNEFVDTTSLK